MALKKIFRLTGKDINFLTKKRQYISAGYFSFFYFRQYENLEYNQISVNITIKLSKRSVVRHLIKRAVVDYIRSQNLIKKTINSQFFRLFVMLNKNNLEKLQKQIEKLDKKHTILLIKAEFENSWKLLNSKIK